MNRPKTTLRRGGFTLIEIMVAMAVFAIVVGAIYSTWTAVIRSAQMCQAVAAQAQRERITVRTIEEALSSTHDFVADTKHYGFVIYNGADPELSFTARLPGSFPRSGRYGDFAMRRVYFTVENGELELRQCPILMEMDDDEREHPLTLARDVKKFFVEAMDARTGEWTDTWLQTNQLPKMVRVTITFDTYSANGQAGKVPDNIQRIISLPSSAVQPSWQKPDLNSSQPGNGRIIGRPGTRAPGS